MEARPPNPTEDFRNLGPIRESVPMALATSSTSASVASQRAETALMDEIRWARKALAVSFDSSEDQTLVVRIFSEGTHFAYTSTKVWIAASPSGDSSPPIRTRSGSRRSSIAVPSARNSGLDRTWKEQLDRLLSRMVRMVSAVLTGSVDFSTTILLVVATSAIFRAHNSMYFKSEAFPAPVP